MGVIKVVSDRPLFDGMAITVNAPCHCTSADSLSVSYLDTSMSFTFRDAHGRDLADINNLFLQGAYIRVILDTQNGHAYIQNADTNSYLESALAGKAPVGLVSVHMTANPTTIDDTLNEFVDGMEDHTAKFFSVNIWVGTNPVIMPTGTYLMRVYRYNENSAHVEAWNTNTNIQLTKTMSGRVWSAWKDMASLVEDAFAPSGFGLGGAAATRDWNEVDSITANGTYGFASINQTINGISVVSATMQVINHNGVYCTQILRTRETVSGSNASYTLIRHRGYIGWTEWECPNPPMSAETEYRTTERYRGKVVYCKSFDCGAMPSSGEKSRNHGTTMGEVVRVSGRIYFANGSSVNLPIMNTVSVHVISSSSIYLWCESGGEQFVKAEVDVYYTKP